MTQKKTYRIAQVNRLLQEEIADILLTELEDERLKQLTITEVRTSKDLRHALVFFTHHNKYDDKELREVVDKSANVVRKTLNQRIRLKYIPELDFRYDDSLDRAEKIFKKLNEIQDDLIDEPSDES